MYCHKCGNKLNENSKFCKECGTETAVKKQNLSEIQNDAETSAIPDTQTDLAEEVKNDIMDAPAPAEPLQQISDVFIQKNISNKNTSDNEIVIETLKSLSNYKLSSSLNQQEAYDMLKTGVSCPKVKSVFFNPKNGAIILKGKIYNYMLRVIDGNVRTGRGFSIPISIILGILIFPLAFLAANIGWDIVDYDFDETYAIPLILAVLAMGIYLTVVSILGISESKIILPHIFGILESKPVILAPRKKINLLFIIIPSIIIIAGITVAALWFTGVLGGSDDYYDAYYENDDNGIHLGRTYTNEEEGFAFDYPSGWTMAGSSELEEDSIVWLFSPGSYANMLITKSYDYNAHEIFFATEEDFLVEFSTIADDVNIIEMTNIDLNGISARKLKFSAKFEETSVVDIQYFYVIDSYIYVITFSSIQSVFNTYEPVFNAIMDSYRITRRNDTNNTRMDSPASTPSQRFTPEETPHSAANAPVIDGVIDTIWNNVERYDLNIIKAGEDTGIRSYFKVLWDEENLYVLVVVPDTTPNHNASANYLRDGIEVVIDFYNTKSTTYENIGQLHLVAFPNGDGFIIGNGAGTWNNSMIDFAVQTSASGYVYEIAFKCYKAIGLNLRSDMLIGIDVQVNDNAEGLGERNCCYSWHDYADEVWHNPSYMGTIMLFAGNNTQAVIDNVWNSYNTSTSTDGYYSFTAYNNSDYAIYAIYISSHGHSEDILPQILPAHTHVQLTGSLPYNEWETIEWIFYVVDVDGDGSAESDGINIWEINSVHIYWDNYAGGYVHSFN
jgi:hypothetical protein